MPPIRSLSYRVLFYYSAYHNMGEFWKKEGEYWAKEQNKLIGPGPGVHDAVDHLVAQSDSPEAKLRKIYAAVQAMENTDFTRERSSSEEKESGLGEIHTTDDVLARKRGSGRQLTALFVAMARAVGEKAYISAVADRDERIFVEPYLSLHQLGDYIAIVKLDGKDVYLDPGSPFCPFGHLVWKNTMSRGLRQTDNGAELASTPSESYKASSTKRVANLTIDEHGSATGTVKITYEGSPATIWRQRALRENKDGIERELRESVEHILPAGLDVKVIAIEHLSEAEVPLTADFNVTGEAGSSAGKRLLMTGDLFEAQSKPTFSHEKREMAVYFHFPYAEYDAVRLHLPPQLAVESLPDKAALSFKNFALYTYATESTPDSFTIRRTYLLGEVIFLPNEYADLRSFYTQMETKDRQSVVLRPAALSAGKSSASD